MTTQNPMFELDEQVAEHVMGFGIWPCCVHGESSIAEPQCEKFRPTTNLLHAWQVVDYMARTRGWRLQLYCEPMESISDLIYHVRFMHRDIGVVSGDAETAPLAICEVALKAVTHAVS